MDANKTAREETRWQFAACNSTSPGSGTPQDTNCTGPLSRNLFKLGEPDMQELLEKQRELIRDVLSPHTAAQKQDDQHERIQQLCEDTGCCPEDLGRLGRSGETGISI